MSPNKRETFLLAALATLLLPIAAGAAALPASASGYSVALETEYGGALPVYYHRGSTYVLGDYGVRYNVRVTNHSGERIEAVVTVDGRDAISGETGNYTRQRGYVVEPYGSVLIDGFRKNMSEVAAFRFTSPGDSYAGRRGTTANTGVVGVAVFRERGRPVAVAPRPAPRPPWYGYDEGGLGRGDGDRTARAEAPSVPPAGEAEQRAKRSAPADARGGALSDDYFRGPTKQNLGTQYGETRHSPVVEVGFQRRGGSPDRVLGIYYDNAEGLAARGINVHPYYSGNPQPFPNNGDRQFAPPPP